MQALSDKERMEAGSFASYLSSENVGKSAGGTEGINIDSIWQYVIFNEVVIFTGVK